MKKFFVLSLLGLLLAGCVVEPGYRGHGYGGYGEEHYQPHYNHW